MMEFENRVLRKKFRPKRDEVTGEWRRLQNDELPYLCSLPNIRLMKFRKENLEWHLARMGGEERCVQGWEGETCRKKTTWKIQA